MNYETLNDNVMLVELSSEEMKNFHITYETMNENNPDTRNAVKNILEKITHSKPTGTHKVTVEALPTDSGGCFFIFTFVPKKSPRYKVRNNDNRIFFQTECLDNLLDVISVSKKQINSDCMCSVFSLDKKYYMSLPPDHKKYLHLFCEYGQINRRICAESLYEHGSFLGNVLI